MKPSLLIPLTLAALLTACGAGPATPALPGSEPQVNTPVAPPAAPAPTVDDAATLTLTPSRALTLDSGATGLAGYFCRFAVCAGDDRDNHQVRGLLEFTLPDSLSGAEILSATLTLKPSNPQVAQTTLGALGSLKVEHVGSLEFGAPALSTVGQTSSSDVQRLDVTQALSADLGRGVSRYRLGFERASNQDDVSNLYRLEVVEPGSPQPSEQAPTLVIRFRAKP